MPTYRVMVEDRGKRRNLLVKARNPAEARRKCSNPDPDVTDRALRYRANQTPPPGERRCAFCGSTRFVEVGHVDGFEENTDPDNLIWNCRSCNTQMGHTFARNNLGRRTRQYNPANTGAKTLGAWMDAVMSIKGQGNMSVPAAVELIHATPTSRRSSFAKQIAQIKKRRGSDRSSEVPF